VRYFILSDIHSNLEALEAVLEDIGKISPSDKLICLGDVVGYGPNPNECIELMKERAGVTIMGNHDHAVLGLTDPAYFNPYAAYMVFWTRSVLSPANREALESYRISVIEGEILFVHATPKDPLNWEYIFSASDARHHLQDLKEHLCFIGHSHVPLYYAMDPRGRLTGGRKPAFTLRVDDQLRYIVNVGSVGQPRDYNPQSAYAIYDVDNKTIEVRRVPYNIQAVQRKMKEADLPPFLINRLSQGV